MLTQEQIQKHYLNPGIRNTIVRVSTDGNNFRAGHWADPKKIIDGEEIEPANWYKYQRDKKFKICFANREDFHNTVSKHRVLYWTLNVFEPGIFDIDYNQLPEKSEAISRKYTTGYTFGIDIDKEHGQNIHDPEVKKAVEDMGQYFSNMLREYAPNSIYCLYSGGGIYVLMHHGCFEPYFTRYRNNMDYNWHKMMRILIDSFDNFIKDKEIEFFKVHPEHAGKVKSDALNNSQRVFKTIFSIHKTLDYAVIPLDPKNIKIDFERATIPIKPDVIEEGKAWYTEYDNGKLFLNKCLMAYMQKAEERIDRKPQVLDEDYVYSSIPIDDMEKWPSCMRNLYNLPSCGEGATRALSAFISFLGQTGIEESEAYIMFSELADRWGARKSNMFEKYFRKMRVPTCRRLISDDNTGFPKGVSIKQLGVCKPDMRCLNSHSPYYYVDKKAKISSMGYTFHRENVTRDGSKKVAVWDNISLRKQPFGQDRLEIGHDRINSSYPEKSIPPTIVRHPQTAATIDRGKIDYWCNIKMQSLLVGRDVGQDLVLETKSTDFVEIEENDENNEKNITAQTSIEETTEVSAKSNLIVTAEEMAKAWAEKGI